MADQQNPFLCTKPSTLFKVCQKYLEEKKLGLGGLTQFMFGTESVPTANKHVDWHTRRSADSDPTPVFVCNPCEDGISVAIQGDQIAVGQMQVPLFKLEDPVNLCTTAPVGYKPVVVNGHQRAFETLPAAVRFQWLEAQRVKKYQSVFYGGLETWSGQLARHGAYEAEFKRGKPQVADFKRDPRLTADITKVVPNAKPFDQAPLKASMNAITRVVQFVGLVGQAPQTDVVFGPGTYDALLAADDNAQRILNQNCCSAFDQFVNLDLKPHNGIKTLWQYHGTTMDGTVNLWTFSGMYTDKKGEKQYHIEPGHMFTIARNDCGYQGQRVRAPIEHPRLHKGDGVYQSPEVYFPATKYVDDFRRSMEFYASQILLPLNPNASGYFKVLSAKGIRDIEPLLQATPTKKAA